MKQNSKIIVGATFLTAAVFGITLLTNRIEICTANECIKLRPAEYLEVKAGLLNKVELEEEFTWEEYTLLIAVLNYETQQDGLVVENVTKKNMLKKISKKLLE